MRRFLTIVALAVACASGLTAQTRWQRDSANAVVLMKFFTYAPATMAEPAPDSIVCAYGANLATMEFDSLVIRQRCGPPADGIFGYVKGVLNDSLAQAVFVPRLCALKKVYQERGWTSLKIMGLIYGIAEDPLGHRVPMVFACWDLTPAPVAPADGTVAPSKSSRS